MKDQWVLLWSQSQNAVHVETLADMLSANRAAYRDNQARDYVPLYLGTRPHVDAAASFCQATLSQREQQGLPFNAEDARAHLAASENQSGVAA
jgi:hypothetical protein